jgi:hypothetical protein
VLIRRDRARALSLWNEIEIAENRLKCRGCTVQGSHERYEVSLAKSLEDLAVLEQAYEDASAREIVFDETVATLVRAKMEHAQADAAMRQMRDEMESLSAANSPEDLREGPAGALVQRCMPIALLSRAACVDCLLSRQSLLR